MPTLMLSIATFLGISVFRLIAYSSIIVAIVTGTLVIRQHYVNIGYHKAIADVKKQDDRAVDAANKVEQRAAQCDESNGYWDVITQNCKLQEQEN